jgi:putative transposase
MIMTTRKRHSPEQVVRKLTQGTACWRRARMSRRCAGSWGCPSRRTTGGVIQFGGLKADDAKRLKDLERENATLKRLLADAELEKAALKEIATGNF